MSNRAVKSRNICLFLWLPAVASAFVLTAGPARGEFLESFRQTRSAEFIGNITPEGVREHVTWFSSLGSRVVGYPGHEAAADMVEKSLRDLELTYVHRETFQLATPLDEGARVESERLEAPIPVHPFWPNVIRLVSTLPDGITGELIYVGRGELEDLNGFRITRTVSDEQGESHEQRAIVLMEFNTDFNYLTLRSLGVGAILFVELEDKALRPHAEAKVLAVPLNVPRFWVSGSEADKLLAIAGRRVQPDDPQDLRVTEGATVTLHSKMQWQNARARNIVARLDGVVPPIPAGDAGKGEKYKDMQDLGRELIVLTAHYDSISVVPSLAPGAEESCGIVTLLELAELLSRQRSRIEAICQAAEGLQDHLATVLGVGVRLRQKIQLHKYSEAVPLLKRVRDAAGGAFELCTRVSTAGPTAVRADATWLGELLGACAAELEQVGQELDEAVEGGTPGTASMLSRLEQALAALGREVQARPVLFVALDGQGVNNMGLSHWMPKHLVESIFTDQVYLPADISLETHEAIAYLDEAIELLTRLAEGGVDCSQGYVAALGPGGVGRGEARAAAERILRRLHERLSRDAGGPTAAAGLDVLRGVREPLAALDEAGLPIDYNGDCPGVWLFDPEQFRRGRVYDFKLLIDLQLTSRSRTVTSIYTGNRGAVVDIKHRRLLAGYAGLLSEYESRMHDVLGGEQAELAPPYYVNGVTPTKGLAFESLIPKPMSLATSSVVWVDLPGMTLRTAYDPRETIDTPSDRPEWMNFDNLAHQMRTTMLLIREALGDPLFVVRGYKRSSRQKYKHGFMGVVMEKKIGESVIANYPVAGALVVTDRHTPLNGVRRTTVGITNHEGKFWDPFYRLVRVKRYAYLLDKAGDIIKAADRGNEGHGTYPLDGTERTGNMVLFKCRSLDIYDNIDPLLIKPLSKVSLFDKYDASPPRFGFNWVNSETEVPPGHVVFFEPHQRIKVCLQRGFWDFQYLLLNTLEDGRENALGFGLSVGRDLRASAFRAAEQVTGDMNRLNRQRAATLRRYGITSELIDGMIENSSSEYELARQHFQQRRYDEYADGMRRARGLVTAAYPLVKQLENDTVQGIVLYFALLIPFAFFCERLLFGFADIKKQILTIAAIFLGVFIIMRIVHPAFMISRSPYVIFLAFIILALAIIVLWLVVGKFNEQMAQLKRAASRIHHTDVGRLSATYAAVMLGISNMRKRRLRTFLTTVTLVLITYAVLSFTSLTSYTHFFELPIEASPSYDGALVRDRMWNDLSREWVEYVEAAFDPQRSTVAPRSWFRNKRDTTLKQLLRYDRRIAVEPTAVVHVSQAEAGVEGANLESLLMTAGGARVTWPRDDQADVCVMTEVLADQLGLAQEDVGSVTLRIAGTDVLLGGILRSSLLAGVTLDDAGGVQAGSADQTLFVSTALLAQLGDRTAPVQIVPGEPARGAGFAERAQGVALAGAQRPAVVKLGRALATGFVGMTEREPKVSKLDRLLRVGRWLSSAYADECVMPDRLARQLNITDEEVASGKATVRIFAQDWRVVGLLAADRLRTFFDLDGGRISPLEPKRTKVNEGSDEAVRIRREEAVAMASTELRDYKHLDPARVVFMPFERVNDLGGVVASIAVGFEDFQEGRDSVRSFLKRSNTLVFLTENGATQAMTSMGRTGVSGLGDLLVPILIGAFIIVNTMMGSVYERQTEIGIYSSVGLAPVHVSALFIAESFVYAVMGAIVGYLIGQVSAKVMVAYGVVGVELNYSSAATMLATVLVMGVVLLSSVYPSRIASQMAVPDVTRRWVLTEPEGDRWFFRFPFTVPSGQVLSLFVFLNNWFDGYREESVGAFYTTELDFHTEQAQYGRAYVISLTMWLAPFDRGVSQRVQFRTMPTEDEGISQIEVEIDRESGEHASWYRLNRSFLREVRKQFLIFRTVPPTVKDQYAQEGTRTLGLEHVPA